MIYGKARCRAVFGMVRGAAMTMPGSKMAGLWSEIGKRRFAESEPNRACR